MAKYYVTSGSFRQIVQADDPQSASLWAMHLAMEQVLPLCDDLRALSLKPGVERGMDSALPDAYEQLLPKGLKG